MTEQGSDASNMRVALEDRLPLAWKPLAAHPEPLVFGRLQLANQKALHAALHLDEYALEDTADERDPNARELGRIDFKINLLLDLVGHLLLQHATLPPEVRVTLTPAEIQWTCESAPELGGLVQIEIYLNPKYPRPLALIGQVAGVTGLAPELVVAVRLDPLAEALQESLEQIIFRHHRRLIAHSKRSVGRREP